MSAPTWVTWTEASVAHAGVRGVAPMDVRNGGFPLECGRYAPEAWDTELWEAPSIGRCTRCQKAVDKREGGPVSEERIEKLRESEADLLEGVHTSDEDPEREESDE